jgi:hypothetical protein
LASAVAVTNERSTPASAALATTGQHSLASPWGGRTNPGHNPANDRWCRDLGATASSNVNPAYPSARDATGGENLGVARVNVNARSNVVATSASKSFGRHPPAIAGLDADGPNTPNDAAELPASSSRRDHNTPDINTSTNFPHRHAPWSVATRRHHRRVDSRTPQSRRQNGRI